MLHTRKGHGTAVGLYRCRWQNKEYYWIWITVSVVETQKTESMGLTPGKLIQSEDEALCLMFYQHQHLNIQVIIPMKVGRLSP